MAKGRDWTGRDIKRVHECWLNGASDKEMAFKFSRTARAISEQREKHGWIGVRHPPPNPTTPYNLTAARSALSMEIAAAKAAMPTSQLYRPSERVVEQWLRT